MDARPGLLVVCLTSVVLLAAPSTFAADWPMEGGGPARTNFRGNVTGPGTGKVIWSFLTNGINLGGSPAVADGLVFIGGSDTFVYALDARNGSLLWKYATGGMIDASPVVGNGSVFVGSRDGYVYALNATTGTLRWRSFAEPDFRSGTTFSNGNLYFQTQGSLEAVRASDGARLWASANRSNRAPPLAVGNAIFATSAPDAYPPTTTAFDDAGDIEWQAPFFVQGLASEGRLLFAGGGIGNSVTALNIKTGERVWANSNSSLDPVTGTLPVVGNGAVLLTIYGGIALVDPTNGAPLKVFPGIKASGATLSVTPTTVFAVEGGNGTIVAIDIASGKVVWRNQVATFSQSSPVVADGILYVNTDQYRIFALDAGAGAPAVPIHNAASPTPSASAIPTANLGEVAILLGIAAFLRRR